MEKICFSLIASTCILNQLLDSAGYSIQEEIIIIHPASDFNVFRHCYGRNEPTGITMDAWLTETNAFAFMLMNHRVAVKSAFIFLKS